MSGHLPGRFAFAVVLTSMLAALAIAGAPTVAVAGDETAAVNATAPADPLFDDEAGVDGSYLQALGSDPFERANRQTLRLNRHLDRWLFDPITKVYGFIVPGPIKSCVRRAFANLDSPSILANDVLQLEWRDAGVTLARFAVNTTVGVGGLFDPATPMGLPGHQSDFGQTLAIAGLSSGPFLMLPAIGPTTPRDGVGAVVDFFLNPATYIVGPFIQLLAGGGSGLVVREANLEALEALQESSVDYYAALRSAYQQNREAQIWARWQRHRDVTESETSVAARPADSARSPADYPHRSWRHRGPFS